MTKVAEATASQTLQRRARARQTAKTRRSVCFVAAQADLQGRCLRLTEALQAAGYSVALYETIEFLRAPNPDFEAYVFHHPSLDFPQLRNVVTTLSNLRRVLISDWDLPLFRDEIYGAEQTGGAEGNEPRRTTDYVAAMKLFPRLSTATTPLTELASLYQPDVELMTVPETISARQKALADVLQVPVTPRNPKSIGFVCRTELAAADFGFIYDVVFKIIAEDPECQLTFFGPIELPGPIARNPRVTFEPALSQADPDLDLTKVACVIEPHVDVLRDRCTTRLGFLQASLAGCQYVATPFPDVSTLKAPNLQLATSLEEWHDHIREAFTRAKSVRAARSAASYVKKNHSSTAALSNLQTLLS